MRVPPPSPPALFFNSSLLFILDLPSYRDYGLSLQSSLFSFKVAKNRRSMIPRQHIHQALPHACSVFLHSYVVFVWSIGVDGVCTVCFESCGLFYWFGRGYANARSKFAPAAARGLPREERQEEEAGDDTTTRYVWSYTMFPVCFFTTCCWAADYRCSSV